MSEPQDSLYDAFDEIWRGLMDAQAAINTTGDLTAQFLMNELYRGALGPVRTLREYFRMGIRKPEQDSAPDTSTPGA